MSASQSSAPASKWEIVAWYHQRTKHHFHQYANSLGYMDWATQPSPFRRYIGTRLVNLPIPMSDRNTPFEKIYDPQGIASRPIDIHSLSELFFYSLALSAWKEAGTTRWALRVNPSSGNLHPTEAYVILPTIAGVDDAPGIYHYAPKEHGLEHRCRFAADVWERIVAPYSPDACFVALSSVPWRESWKYGERALRYCQHDVGHALASLRISASLLGWRLELLAHISDDVLGHLLGLDRRDEFDAKEPEVPDLLAVITPANREGALPQDVHLDETLRSMPDREWFGRANQLSPKHHEWEIIDFAEDACHLNADDVSQALPAALQPPTTKPTSFPFAPGDKLPVSGKTADLIIRGRRSAVDMDGKSGISTARFYHMLQRLLPKQTPAPWDCLPWRPLIHLGLFVHRVEGISPGLYAFVRSADSLAKLRASMSLDFLWSTPPGCPADFPLYLLREMDVRATAKQVSCHQDIAGDGAFSLGMFAEFEPILREHGAHWYRRLFWETGMIGQVLYLETEAAGIRATGIGCFFDDAVHELFGLPSTELQTLYHFTVGAPVEDDRLTTLPPYANLSANR